MTNSPRSGQCMDQGHDEHMFGDIVNTLSPVYTFVRYAGSFNRSPARLAAGSSNVDESRATDQDNAARISQRH
jgi:hypothetical protein